jgi:N-acetylneuraminic acid mutarotase
MQEGRSGYAAAVVDGKIYVCGGEVLVQPYFVRDTAEVFDPASNSWRFIAKLPGPLHGTGAVGYMGRMFVFGGASMAASATPRMGAVTIFTP